MHLIVIGGNGFIGSHFVAAAVERGHEVTVVGRRQEAPLFPHGMPFRFIGGGIDALLQSGSLLQSADVVCHMAAFGTPAEAEAEPEMDEHKSLMPLVDLLAAMRTSGPQRLVYVSSGGAVYGRPQYTPIPETHPLNPIGVYGRNKRAAEERIATFEAETGIKSLIVRPSNPYGPGQPIKSGAWAIPTFLNAALNARPVTLFGGGTIVRDFIFVSDLAEFLVKAVEQGASGTFNCGAGIGTSLMDLLDQVEQITGNPVVKDIAPARPFDPAEIVLDISKAHRELSWSPKVTLSEGLRMTVESISG